VEAFKVKSIESQGGAKLLLFSVLALILLLLTLQWSQQFSLWHALVLIACGLGIFAGWAKLAAPEYFLQYDELGVCYQHQHGRWLLRWNDFLYCGIAQLGEQKLAYIGFKVTDYDSFLQRLPLRFAVRLMTEQRELFLSVVKRSCANGRCATDLMLTDALYDSGKAQYNGVRAAFAHRMRQLSAETGFDVFIPVNMDESEIQPLCQQINQLRLQLIQNTVT